MTRTVPPCRSCGGLDLELILSLGRVPLANALLTAEQLHEREPTYPLDLVFCPRCSLVQITETVPPDILFGHYLYFSSISDTMVEHGRRLADQLVETLRLNSESLVVEAGSNDGYLLQHFANRGVPVLGVDPAENVAVAAESRGISTLRAFFGASVAESLRTRTQGADVVIACNVLAHVAELNGFVEGVRLVLKEGGTAVVEVPYVRDLIERAEFDTIYHEHLCYFSLTAMDRLFRRHALVPIRVERLPIHGGSLRVYAGHLKHAERDESVRALLEEEDGWAVGTVDPYRAFGRRVKDIRGALRTTLVDLKAAGKSTAAYGAAAKGTILLNYCDIGPDLVQFVVDRSPHKQGRYIPGVRLPVRSPEKLLELMPEYVLLLAWNLADEILAQQQEYRRRGGRFIIPVPDVRIV